MMKLKIIFVFAILLGLMSCESTPPKPARGTSENSMQTAEYEVYTPSWPFRKNDPLLWKDNNRISGYSDCNNRFRYRPVRVEYCLDKGKSAQCRGYDITNPAQRTLPPLNKKEWPYFNPPVYGKITLRTPDEGISQVFRWRLDNKQAGDLPLPKEWEHLPSMMIMASRELREPALEYSRNYRIHLYDSRQACQSGQPSKINHLYERVILQSQEATVCTWAKVMESKRPVSECVQGVFADNYQKIRFDLKSNRYSSKRLLILVVDSESINQKMGRVISNGLLQAFKHLGNNNLQVAVTLARLNEAQGTVEVILEGEELKSMFHNWSSTRKTPPELLERVRASFPFNQESRSSTPLESLIYIEHNDKFEVSKLKKVLYIIDADSVPEREYILASGKMRTMPLHWRDRGISFSVLTNGKCESWAAVRVKNCYLIDSSLDRKWLTMQLKNRLLDFLGIGKF